MTIQLMSEREAARRLDLSIRSMQRLRETGEGPPFYKISAGHMKGRVAYREEDLAAWLEGRRRTSTSESGSPP